MDAETDAGHAWVAHLRAGGTTPWAEFRDHPAAPHADRTATPEEGEGRIPGAQQLEVLRRLNELGRPDPRLAAEVLAVAPPGRGSLDLPLVGLPSRSYGSRPVDPSRLDATELARVVTGVLADRLAAADLTEPAPPSARERIAALAAERLPRRHAYRVVGPRTRVDPVRARLRELGREPGGRDAVHYVLGADTGRLVTDAWTSRVVEGVAPPWPEWLTTWLDQDACPPRADLGAVADHWARLRGRAAVEVVLDAGLLGGLVDAPGPVSAAPSPPAAAVELVRQVSAVLGVLVERPLRSRLLGELLVPRLADAEGPTLVVPDRHADWLARRGRALHEALSEGGYRVHGPTGLLTDPPPRAGVGAPDADAVLRLGLRTLGRWDEGPAGGGRVSTR